MTAPSPTQPEPAPAGMAVPALIVALTMMGDTLLYAVLPLYAADFGVSLVVVGILLSLNRWVRLVANSVVAAIGNRFGPRRLMIFAAVAATASTVGYVVAPDPASLMVSRVVWGIAFASMNLALIAYAVSDRANAGKRVGAGRAAIGFFQAAALVGGTLLVAVLGARDVFLVMAAASAIAIALSWWLPSLTPDPRQQEGFRLPMPGRLEVWGFSLGLVVDGIFLVTLSLLMKDTTLPLAPVVVTGVLLATRWLIEVLVAPATGTLADRLGARRLTLATGTVLLLGLALVAAGHDLAGAALVVTTRGIFNTLLPVMVAERAVGSAMTSQATYSTWRDFGAAVGPVVAGIVFTTVAQPLLYGTCAALLALLLWLCVGRR
ncbi:MAG TPA: MFS transporter [Vineibacter sp.]|nr:MFS transporter [Vineibacter sp.]